MENRLEMSVYVVWDELLERVVSVHATEAGAEKVCTAHNKGSRYLYSYEKYEVVE